jgi:hypothetical protein
MTHINGHNERRNKWEPICGQLVRFFTAVYVCFFATLSINKHRG